MQTVITKEWLRQTAGNTIFNRGEDIYDLQGMEVIKNGNVYTAEVWGSDIYKVTIEETGEGMTSSCNCPYDSSDVCKHVVAVGLKIAEGEFTEEQTIAIREEASHNGFYENIFLAASEVLKNNFLKQLFEKDHQLRSQFINFLDSHQKPKVAENNDVTNIDKIKSDIRNILSGIDLDVEDFHETIEYDYYDDSGDQEYEWAKSEVMSVLKPYYAKAKSYFHTGKIVEGTKILLGIYEGCHGLIEPIYNNGYEELFISYEGELMAWMGDELEEIKTIFDNTILSDEQMMQAQDEVFNRFLLYHSQKGGPALMNYNFKELETFLLGLIYSPKTAAHADKFFKQFQLFSENTIYIELKITELSADIHRWVKAAEKYAGNELDVAKNLIDYYYKNNEQEKLVALAKRVFVEPNEYSLSEFLLEKLDKDWHLELYIKVLAYHTERNDSILHYKELRKLLSTEAKEQFIRKIKGGYFLTFYVKILEVEQRFEEILAIVKKNITNYGFIDLIQPILTIYPEECYHMITKKSLEKLETGERGRTIYSLIAKELALMKDIPEYDQRIKAFVAELLKRFYRLSALKDELRLQRLLNS